MAKKSATKEAASDPTPGILPVPEPVIRHHLQATGSALREWQLQKRVPPVLLLTGTAGCGKRNFSYWLSQWILCDRAGFSQAPSTETETLGEVDMFGSNLFGGDPIEPPTPETSAPQAAASSPEREPGPCGECASCQRALRGHWVDFTEVLPEDSGEGNSTGTLKVDQFRELKQKLGFGAHEGSYRIVLIPNADRMTAQAANSVLKLLEEPPPGWVFFLTASDPTLVLPTILSRCQQLKLRPFQPAELEELLSLSDLSADRRRVCAQLAQGSWTKAILLAEDEMWESRKALLDFVQDPAMHVASLVDWASQTPRNFDLMVDQLELITGDLIRWTIRPGGHHIWSNSDGAKTLESHAKAVAKRQGSETRARDFWIDRSFRLARARQESLAPLNRKLLIQDLLLPWLEAV